MLSELGWESLEARRKRSLVSFYKLVNSCFEIPKEYHPRTKPPGPTRRANTRQYNLMPAEVLAYSNSFIPRTIDSVVEQPSGDRGCGSLCRSFSAEASQRSVLNHPGYLPVNNTVNSMHSCFGDSWIFEAIHAPPWALVYLVLS